MKPKSTPNRLSGKEARQGCLVRVQFEGLKAPGHADLFPWPELGDPSLKDQIESLTQLTPFSQAAATLMWAHYEALAIEKKKSLLSDADYPSHVTLTENRAIPSYAKTVKLKITSEAIHNWRETEKFIKEYPTLLWRLDFNGLFQARDEAQNFWNQVHPNVKSQIEFLEDPFTPELMEDAVALKIF
ncbi:MAG: hypothetical protein K2P81_16150, partial [Bacteriovoracaceae bacterium]|nr:hypothetical protein [Bacteriovoracaceae bacterium]